MVDQKKKGHLKHKEKKEFKRERNQNSDGKKLWIQKKGQPMTNDKDLINPL